MGKEPFNQSKYINGFIAETYDRVNLTMPKGKKEKIKAHADSREESVNRFINRAIDETMKSDNAGEREGE